MDSLTFGSEHLLRGFNSKKEPITQINLKAMLEGFEMTMDEFIDLCIMCGCDYTHSIAGVGPVKAFKYVTDHKNIENILEVIKENNEDETKKKKYQIPEKFLYKESRELFKNPDVLTDMDKLKESLKWGKPDESRLREFLCEDKGFTEVKVNNGIERLGKSNGKANQSRLDLFFKSAGTTSSTQQKSQLGKGKGGAGGARAKSMGGKGRR